MKCKCWLNVGKCKCEVYIPSEQDKMKLEKQRRKNLDGDTRAKNLTNSKSNPSMG